MYQDRVFFVGGDVFVSCMKNKTKSFKGLQGVCTAWKNIGISKMAAKGGPKNQIKTK